MGFADYLPIILVRKSIQNIDNSIKNEQRMMQGFQLESNRRKAEMDCQINVRHNAIIQGSRT